MEKCLKETYLHKVKMIYIDPPYNTGNDFVYEDDFAQTSADYLANSGQYDEQGNRMFTNAESNGRFHTDWLNMIYPRLKAARDLLTDDGAIFISIGDDEGANLQKVGDEIFGEKNFIADICHKHRASVSNDRIISENHNHLLFYAKNINVLFTKHKQIGEDPVLSGFNQRDEKGEYRLTPVDGPGGAKKGNPYYEFLGVTGYWRYSKDMMQKKYDQGLIVRTPNGLQQKYYLEQAKNSRRTVTTWWDEDFLTSSATKQLTELMGAKTFDNPKNVNLLIRCLKMITKFDKDALVLDFFSGSCTTAHAVMQLNAEDGGNRKFIMVQLPEKTEEKSEAYKAGYKTICEIGKERIRRAGKKIKEESPLTTQDLDTGFRVLKLDSTNMEDIYYSPKDISQATLIVDHITYNEIEGSYDSAIFTEEKHTSLDKAFLGKKSIVDYVFTDGTAEKSVERKFVEDLDTSTDVAVYAKLPKGFHIPTPVGNYSPDWAIAFREGTVKHIYFIAETKGSMSSLDIREIERGKIACADKLFEQLSGSGIYYHKVTNYDDLMEWVK